MSKAVLISIQPKWCEMIESGKKTVEVRKTKPQIAPPFKVYIYATWNGNSREILLKKDSRLFVDRYVNYLTTADRASGRVIGEFVCDRIIDISRKDLAENYRRLVTDIIAPSCIKVEELKNYLGYKDGYGWHISNLVIYEKPRELYDFINHNKHEGCLKKDCFSGDCWRCPNNAIMVRPPQSWCYVEEV